jgi:para-aminobenzoate synthetase
MPDVAELAELISRLTPQCGTCIVVAVDGPSGAGKTRLSRQLAARLGGDAEILHFDHVYPGWQGLVATPPVVAHDVLEPIARGEPGRTPRWDWGADVAGDDIVLPPSDILLLDGCGSGARVIRQYLSLLVWLDAPADVRRARAESRGDDTVAQWWDLWAAQEKAHFAAEGTAAAADLTLPG